MEMNKLHTTDEPQRRLSTEELILLNCGAREYFWETLGLQEIKPVNPEGNQPWIFIGRTDAEASMLWPPDVKSRLIGKDPDAQKDLTEKQIVEKISVYQTHLEHLLLRAMSCVKHFHIC